MRDRLPRPGSLSWGSASRALAALLALTGLAWYFGADLAHAVLLASALTVFAWLSASVPAPPAESTDWRDPLRSKRVGSRSDLAQLSRSLREGRGRVGDAALGRARRIAQRRLMAHGVDLLDPADRDRVDQLIGRPARRVLATGRRRRPVSLRSLRRCLDALDALDKAQDRASAG